MILAGCGLAASYSQRRPWCLTWGAQPDEVGRDLPGDDLLPKPDILTTRAISIDAPSEAIWPWLVQMGSGRGGLYTYDWIENLFGLDMHSVDVVLPEFQNIEIGYAQRLGKRGPTLRVTICDVGQALVLLSDDGNWVWAFVLLPRFGGARLISRNRIATTGASPIMRLLNRYVMEPGSLIMERKMLLGIKERAERLDREPSMPLPVRGSHDGLTVRTSARPVKTPCTREGT